MVIITPRVRVHILTTCVTMPRKTTSFQQLETVKRLFIGESIRLHFTAWKSEELDPCNGTPIACYSFC